MAVPPPNIAASPRAAEAALAASPAPHPRGAEPTRLADLRSELLRARAGVRRPRSLPTLRPRGLYAGGLKRALDVAAVLLVAAPGPMVMDPARLPFTRLRPGLRLSPGGPAFAG